MSNEKVWRRLAFLIARLERAPRIPMTNRVAVDRDDLQELMNIATLWGDIPEAKRVADISPFPRLVKK